MVKRKGNKLLITSIIVVIVLLGIGVVMFQLQQTGLGGFSTLSISNVEIVGDGQFIRVFGVATGAEALSIDFRPSQINQYINDDGFSATKNVVGSITLDKQLKSFPIIKETDKNFFIARAEKVGLLSSCPSVSGYTYIGKYISLSFSKVCFYKKGVGINSEFSGQSIRDSQINFDIGGATGILRPSSGFNTITLNDGKTKIEWTGDLSNYNQITAPFSYSVLFHESKFQKLIDDDAYVLTIQEVTKLNNCLGISNTGGFNIISGLFEGLSNLRTNSQVDNCINIYNNKIDNLLVDRTSLYKSSINAKGISFITGDISTTTNLEEGSLIVDLKTADAFPTFIITLDAFKVGIIELKGTPSIVSCVPDNEINSGDSISPTLTVKNIGESDGSFFGRVTCSGDAIASGIISEQFFKAGETKNMPVQVTGQNIEVDTSKFTFCTYTIEDRKSGSTVSCTSKLDVTYQSGLICDPNSVTCLDANILRTCSDDGKLFSDTTCTLGCQVLSSGEGICKVKEGNGGDFTCSKFWQEYREEGSGVFGTGLFKKQAGCYTSGWVSVVIVFLVLVIIFIIFRILRGLISPRK